MKPKGEKKEKLYTKKASARKEKALTEKRRKEEVLDTMMDKARANPTYKTLSRIIQMIKAVFMEKEKASKKNEGDDVDMVEASKKIKSGLKIFTQALNQEEYRKLLKFFCQELPTLAMQFCDIKDFPSVDKVVSQHKFKSNKKEAFDVKKAYSSVSQ